MRDGDAEAADAQGPGLVDEAAQVLPRHAEGHVDLVQSQVRETGVMDQGAEAVPDGIGHHAVDLGVGVDLLVAIDLGHVLEAELARRQGPLRLEGGVGAVGAELARQDAGGHADVAHSQADRGDLGLADHLQDADVVGGVVDHRRDLHDVRVALRQAAVDLGEVLGRLAEVVEADDPLGLAEAGNGGGDIVFQVDVLDPFGDGRPQEELPLLFRPVPLPAVGGAAAGDHYGARPLGDQAAEVDGPADVVQPQLDQLGPQLGEVPMFVDHETVAAAADADANHNDNEAGWMDVGKFPRMPGRTVRSPAFRRFLFGVGLLTPPARWTEGLRAARSGDRPQRGAGWMDAGKFIGVVSIVTSPAAFK